MVSENCFDVTKHPAGNPYEDIGAVINGIIADIKSRQPVSDLNDGGKPGAVIYIPPGDYRLVTQVVIDLSYLKIVGSGHGFTSSSIRFNVPANELTHWHEVWPGGSRILVDTSPDAAHGEAAGAAFYVKRIGNPRISSVEFADFCIDGLHFIDDGSGQYDSENTYRNGKTGIYVGSANDSIRITGMGLIYLEHGVTVHDADALAVDNNFIAECGNCIELKGMGQATRIANNFVGAGYRGHSIYAENYGGILVSSNNVFPRGASSVYFSGVVRSSVTGNRFHSFYPGMLVFAHNCCENLVSSNHFLRDREPWAPMQKYDNGLDDLFGLLHIDGSNNSVIANHISETIDIQYIKPVAVKPVIIKLVSGSGNYIANNHIVATTEISQITDAPDSACFSTQVGALLSTDNLKALEVTAILVQEGSVRNTVLDSGRDEQVEMDRTMNAFRATPAPGNSLR
ncbi:NosD domain-containing protein [Rhizobium sp. NZLR1]|uniref:NosD domain-containing protein n=1 Tax=Rhizobium sp. NZLR1 TaxID=2731096 RepID=UPI001A98F265|nr:NosD domain-containing protein [Rhizobium sp. NZLR1]MBX5205313.1 right-handed parallel beta-helix repeat-containing protein [Rhizobium sp. NZLR1]QSZ23125.1 right-handed parallel beta-helix repeat-containing protein [Rhizobium sp. NZLR1]